MPVVKKEIAICDHCDTELTKKNWIKWLKGYLCPKCDEYVKGKSALK